MKVFSSILLLTALPALLAGCRKEEVRPSAVRSEPARVVLSRAERIPVLVRTTGVLRAHESSLLAAQTMGRVQRLLVREGDMVHAGQLLAVLEDAALQAGSAQSEAALKAAEQQQAAAEASAALASETRARYAQLQAQRSVSAQEMDEVTRRAQSAQAQAEAMQAQSAAMRAQLSAARATLSYTRIRAPFAGVITARMADPGAMAMPGAPLLQIESQGPLELATSVDESVIAAVRKGMKVEVETGSEASARTGLVSEIQPVADPASHSVLVKIVLPRDAALRAGMYATAGFMTGEKQAVLAPRSAIMTRGSLHCVYALDASGVAQLRYVTLGAARGEAVEVLSGLAAGERLVDAPAERDLAGVRIEVRR